MVKHNDGLRPPVLMREALEISGYRSPTSLWTLERKGLFPKRRKLGPNRIAWLREDIELWLKTRPAGIGAAVRPA